MKLLCIGMIYFLTYGLLCDTAQATQKADIVKERYHKAQAAYERLMQETSKQKYRHHFLPCINNFNAVYAYDPEGPWAAAALFRSAELYYLLYTRSLNIADRNNALNLYEKIIIDFPHSTYYLRAQDNILQINTTAGIHRPKALFKKSRSKPPVPSSPIHKRILTDIDCIVIDPGHGGKDYGAPGYFKGIHEKYVVMEVAGKLQKKMQQHLECNVILTRQDDTYLSLEKRTAIANTNNADLFISIHTNASKNKRAYGTEIYVLNNASDADAIKVAARENDITPEEVSDVQLILISLLQNAKIDESGLLANHINRAIDAQIAKQYFGIKNYGIRQAPFYVLLGAHMPCILIEMGFISNPGECKRLSDNTFQEHFCEAIIEGIIGYAKDIHPTTLIAKEPKSNSNQEVAE